MTSQTLLLAKWIMRVRPAPLAAFLKKLLFIQRIEHASPEGTFWIDPASYQGLALARSGIYEPEMLATVKSLLPTGGVFVDVGANEGYFSVVAARTVGRAGKVIAIEPQSRLQSVLQRNFALNHCEQVHLVCAAISDRAGEATLHLTPGVNNSASSLLRPTRYPLFRQSVRTTTLSALFDESGVTHCDLLKIDIEGWEYEAVLGSRTLFESGLVRAIALELHPRALTSRGLEITAITDFLTECGYQEQPGVGHLLLVKS